MSRKTKPCKKTNDGSASLKEREMVKESRQQALEKDTEIDSSEQAPETWLEESHISESEIEKPVADESCAEYRTEESVQSPHRRPKHKNNNVGDTLGPVEKIIIKSDLFPNSKRLKQNPLNGSEKQTVINIYKKLQETWKEGRLSKSEISQKTADVAGICRTTVYKILKEYKTEGRVQSPPHRRPKRKKSDDLDDVTLEAIRKKVDSFSDKSLNEILEAINSDASLPNFSRTGLYRLLNDTLQFNIRTRRKKVHS